MTHITFIDAIDIVALLSIVLLIGDELRLIDARRQPVLALAFVLIAIGSFIGVCYDIGPGTPKWWSVLIDVGIAIYVAFLHRRMRVWRGWLV